MRIKSVSVENFRGFLKRKDLNLDSDFVFIFGSNGTGKTSLFDAIEWSLFGSVARLTGSRDFFGASPYANALGKGQPKVCVSFRGQDDDVFVEREGLKLTVRTRTTVLNGSRAQEHLLSLFPRETFDNSIYLGQQKVSSFITKSPRDRYEIVLQLLGFGRVTAFLETLKLAKTELKVRADAADKQVDALRNQLLGARETITLDRERLKKNLESLGIAPPSEQGKPLEHIESEVQSVMEKQASLSLSVAEAKTKERQIQDLLSALREIEEKEQHHGKQGISLADDRKALVIASRSLADAQEECERISDRLRNLNSDFQAAESSSRSEIELLSLALNRMMGDLCPVCEQAIDGNVLRGRIELRTRALDQNIVALARNLRTEKDALAQRKRHTWDLQTRVEALRLEVSSIERGIAEQMSRKSGFDEEVQSMLGLSPDISGGHFEDAKSQIESLLNATRSDISSLEKRSNDIQLELLRLEYLRKSLELVAFDSVQLPRIQDALQGKEALLRARNESLNDVKQAERETKRAQQQILREVLDRYGPIVSDNYARLNPHPFFKDLRMRIDSIEAGGELYADVILGGLTANARVVFSEGQTNSLALCIFLSLCRYGRTGAFDFVALDDPVQAIDSIGQQGLIDLLDSLAGQRQIILSTHDAEFFELVKDRLGPSRGITATALVFGEYTPSGPSIRTLAMEDRLVISKDAVEEMGELV